nr:hypothetical protein [Tanacetum cinerariifolium]
HTAAGGESAVVAAAATLAAPAAMVVPAGSGGGSGGVGSGEAAMVVMMTSGGGVVVVPWEAAAVGVVVVRQRLVVVLHVVDLVDRATRNNFGFVGKFAGKIFRQRRRRLAGELFDWDEELVSSRDAGVTRVKEFMTIAEDEPSVRKVDAISGQWIEINLKKRDEIFDLKKVIEKWISRRVTLDQFLSEQVRRNIVYALSRRGKRKERISSKEVLFTKVDESRTETAPKITSESECNIQESLPPLPKLLGAEPTSTSAIKAPKKRNQTFPDLNPEKKADSSTEQLLLTLMKEVKGLKEKIKIPSDTTLSVSQSRCSKSAKGKQKIWFGPCKHYRFKNHLSKDCYMKPKCSTCGSINHLTKEHPEQAAIKKTLEKLKA